MLKIDAQDFMDQYVEGGRILPNDFDQIEGDVTLGNTGLTSLENCPREIIGGIQIWGNLLTSLSGAPQIVTGNFNCSRNQLDSLEGGPREVGGSFECQDNCLTSLEGAPEKVKEAFFCGENQLTSLKGCPSELESFFDCSDNQLKSLEGGPQKAGSYNCSNNKLTSLKGAAREVTEYDFECTNNQLTSLEGGPDSVARNFECERNPLKSLDGAPGKLGGEIISDLKDQADIQEVIDGYDELCNGSGAPGNTTPIFFACDKNDYFSVQYLIDNGADVNHANDDGFTPLHVLAKGWGGEECARLLLDNGADLDIASKDESMTPLHWAAATGKSELVELFLSYNPDLNLRNNDGKTALEIVTQNYQNDPMLGYEETIAVLEKYAPAAREKPEEPAQEAQDIPEPVESTIYESDMEEDDPDLDESMEMMPDEPASGKQRIGDGLSTLSTLLFLGLSGYLTNLIRLYGVDNDWGNGFGATVCIISFFVIYLVFYVSFLLFKEKVNN